MNDDFYGLDDIKNIVEQLGFEYLNGDSNSRVE